MTLKRIYMSAMIALGMAAAWGQYAMAADATQTTQDQAGHANHAASVPAVAGKEPNDMAGMDHSSGGDDGDMTKSMQGGSAPADARDPHAYSGGYDFGPIPRPRMGDEDYMAGLMIDRLERVQGSNAMFNAYDLQGWVGKDYERLVLKAEGEVAEGKLHEARTELLWGHAVSAYWDTQLGARQDSGVAPERSWLALGIQGLAPYWFEVEATAYVGEQGRTAFRLAAEYELLLTQKLILQPRIEANFYGMQDEARELGAGLSSLVAGVRLRYEIKREFAPYVGVDWNGKFGGTADYARTAGARTSDTSVVAGVRLWF